MPALISDEALSEFCALSYAKRLPAVLKQR